MKIIKAYPPNYPAISKAFPHIKGLPGIVYAYGDTIYNPNGGTLPIWIIEHEEVHGRQQDDDIECWWDQYLYFSGFRLDQEIPAHRAEWVSFIEHNKGMSYDRAKQHLDVIVNRLAGPLYGNVITPTEALHEITCLHS